MEDGAKAQALMDMDDSAFEDEMMARSTGLLGPLKLASHKTIWPIIAQYAESLRAQRLAIVAEAAHVVPPIGAQGLNMSLKDMAVLLELAKAAPERLGDAQMLEAYHRQRIADIRARVAGITLLNRTSQQSGQLMRDARAKGIELLHDIKPVRTALMQLGLGAR